MSTPTTLDTRLAHAALGLSVIVCAEVTPGEVLRQDGVVSTVRRDRVYVIRANGGQWIDLADTDPVFWLEAAPADTATHATIRRDHSL
jgi:hypothetical protein